MFHYFLVKNMFILNFSLKIIKKYFFNEIIFNFKFLYIKYYLIIKKYLIYQICISDPRCERLQLEDLLISPLQRITRLPLLLK